jgi:hypothetical protein
LSDRSLARTLVGKGRLRRKLFSSDGVAAQMIGLYREFEGKKAVLF